MLLRALLVLAPALAPDQAPPDELQAILALCVDQGFEDEWYHTHSEKGLKITSVNQLVRGQAFSVCVFMTGYAVGPKGHVDSSYDLRIIRPDGTSYLDKHGIELCVSDGLSAGHAQIARVGLNLSIDAPEPLGTYKFLLQVHDQVGGHSASTEDSLTLTSLPQPRPFQTRPEFEAWMLSYYRTPRPVRVLDAVASASAVQLFDSASPDFVLRGFLSAVCRDNPFLEPALLERFPKLEHAARLAALELLSLTAYDAKPFLAAATEEERKAYETLHAAARPDPLAGPIRDAAQLDELWGSFLAGGRFAPIERLARALALDEQLDGKQKDAATSALESAARSALQRNLRMPRVRPYCEWLLANRKLDERDAAELKKLLED